jgi:hypothetical protein
MLDDEPGTCGYEAVGGSQLYLFIMYLWIGATRRDQERSKKTHSIQQVLPLELVVRR